MARRSETGRDVEAEDKKVAAMAETTETTGTVVMTRTTGMTETTAGVSVGDERVVTFRGREPQEGLVLPADALDAFRSEFMRAGDWFRGRDDDPYVTYVVIRDRNPDGSACHTPSETDAMEAALSGIVRMLSQVAEDPHVRRRVMSWCSSRIRKVVKRASGARWERLAAEAISPLPDGEQEGLAPMHGAVLVEGVGRTGASAVVTCPMRASAQPRALRRLQVSGLSLDRGPSRPCPSGPALRIALEEGAGMTSGKAIAQAGHAVQLAFRLLADEGYERWAAAGWPTDVSYGDIGAMSAAAMPDVTVTDAGFTEVMPGTRTCAAWLSDSQIPSVTFE